MGTILKRQDITSGGYNSFNSITFTLLYFLLFNTVSSALEMLFLDFPKVSMTDLPHPDHTSKSAYLLLFKLFMRASSLSLYSSFYIETHRSEVYFSYLENDLKRGQRAQKKNFLIQSMNHTLSE